MDGSIEMVQAMHLLAATRSEGVVIGKAAVTVFAPNTQFALALPIGGAFVLPTLQRSHRITTAGKADGGPIRVGVVTRQTGLTVFSHRVVATANADATRPRRLIFGLVELAVLRVAVALAG